VAHSDISSRLRLRQTGSHEPHQVVPAPPPLGFARRGAFGELSVRLA
jgi:hypothetical protein